MKDICCTACFKDADLQQHIRVNGAPLTAPCHHCGAAGGIGIELDELESLFRPVIDEHFTVYDNLPDYRHVDPMSGDSLEYLVDMHFDLFADSVGDKGSLLFGILNSKTEYQEPDEFSRDSMWFSADQDVSRVSFEELNDEALSTLTKAIKTHGHSIVTLAEHAKLTREMLEAYNDILVELTQRTPHWTLNPRRGFGGPESGTGRA